MYIYIYTYTFLGRQNPNAPQLNKSHDLYLLTDRENKNLSKQQKNLEVDFRT